jgi:hypothetical protein
MLDEGLASFIGGKLFLLWEIAQARRAWKSCGRLHHGPDPLVPPSS